VLADAHEIGDNVRTGRVLWDNHNMTLEVRKHLIEFGLKNPEYTLDNMLADAKRIKKWEIAYAFKSAIEQGARVVIVDLYKMYAHPLVRLNENALANNIANRIADFKSGEVERCYVVWGEKSIVITRDIFDGYNSKNVHLVKEIEALLRKLL
jgi:hypothetical protein